MFSATMLMSASFDTVNSELPFSLIGRDRCVTSRGRMRGADVSWELFGGSHADDIAPKSDAAAPLDAAKTVARARAAWQGGRADEAEMLCRQVLAVWPGQTDAAYLLGLMSFTYGNLDLAIAHVREACQAPRAPAVYFSDFAEMLRQKGLLAEAEQAARRAVALSPNFAPARDNLGIVLQEALKLDESRLCLERALALEGDNAQTLNNLANTLKRLGLAAEAEKRWNAALALKPDYAEAYSNLANLLLDQGEYDRAEASARRAIKLSPRLANAYVNLAAVRTARHAHGHALQILDALLAFAPGHSRALAARALTLKELDRLGEALEAAKRAALAAPDSPEPHNAIGQVYQAMGAFEPALAAYDRAAALPGAAGRDRQPRLALHGVRPQRRGAQGDGGGGEGLPQFAGRPLQPDRP
jgi:tetratricopeptide (TPR) repeat protein